MKTRLISIMKKVCLLCFLIVCISANISAQQRIPKNYLGASGIIELNRLAVGLGLEYERWLYTNNRFALGAKAHYIFPSKTIRGLFSGGEVYQRNRQAQLMATTYLFTDPDKEIKGFFFSFGAGVNFIKWDAEAYDASGNSFIRSVSEVSPGFELAFGRQLNGKRRSSRVTAGYQAFAGDKYEQYQSGNGVSLFFLKVSIGF